MQSAVSAVTWHSEPILWPSITSGQRDCTHQPEDRESMLVFHPLSLSLPLFLPPLIFQVPVDCQMGSQANTSISSFASPETKYNFLL